jgi:hypothetical protein
VRDNLAAGANERMGIDIQMEVGVVSETFNVMAEASVLQTTTVSTGKLISSAQIENMPVSGRTPLALVGRRRLSDLRSTFRRSARRPRRPAAIRQ